MTLDLTLALAAWGAVLGTLSLGWNIWTWSKNKPEILARVEMRERPAGDIIAIEIRNRGTRSTTLEEITLLKYCDGIAGMLGVAEHTEFVSVKYRDTCRLPAVLGANEVWQGECPAAPARGGFELDKPALVNAGRLFYKIRCAHSDRRISGRVKREGLHLFD